MKAYRQIKVIDPVGYEHAVTFSNAATILEGGTVHVGENKICCWKAAKAIRKAGFLRDFGSFMRLEHETVLDIRACVERAYGGETVADPSQVFIRFKRIVGWTEHCCENGKDKWRIAAAFMHELSTRLMYDSTIAAP